jgi:predicted  nucleic acid-binding Zn-ribbon protein
VALEESQATLKLRNAEITRLGGELVQKGVSYEELRQAGEKKDATILELRRTADTACASLETEMKQVEGESPFACLLLVDSTFWDPLPIFVFCLWISGLQTALGNLTTQTRAVQMAYNSSQQELEELRAAALEACQEVEEGEAQAGSSISSRLRALGGHVTRCMRRTLHLGD